MPNLSNILIGISLALLATFLGYWLYEAYRNELKALENELQLEITKQLLKDSNIDFPVLLDQIQNLKGINDVRWKVLISDDDSLQLGNVSSLEGTTTLQDEYVFSEFYSSNSLDEKLDTNMDVNTRVIFSNISTSQLDTFSKPSLIKSTLLEAAPKLPYQAFLGIIPQIGFAIFLLGMTIIAIWSSQRYYQQQQINLKAKNQFISNMAHELRTPVTTIGIALEAIQDFDLMNNPEKTKSYLQTSRSELERLNTLIEQVLNVAKQKDHINFYDKKDIEFQPIIEEALKVMDPKINAHQAFIETASPSKVLKIRADALHLKNTIQNLIDNALKYNPKGVQITLSTSIDSGHLIFKVSDNGIGIPKKYQKQVFDQFFRVPTGDIHNVKGHGLGLAYVQKTIEAHSGSVDLKSQENKGTTISLKLPLIDG